MSARAHLSVLVVVVVWAGSFSVIKELLDDGVAAADIAILRYAIAAPGFAFILWRARGLPGLTRADAVRIATAAGVTLGILTWAAAASVGVVALLRASEPVFQTLKLAGAVYLAYLGLVSLWAAVSRRPHEQRSRRSMPLVPRRAFRQGLLSNLGNPKIAVFFASLLPQFVPDGSGAFAASLALGLLFATMGLAWLTTYAVVVARLGDVLSGPVRRALDALAGAILVALGVRLATEDR